WPNRAGASSWGRGSGCSPTRWRSPSDITPSLLPQPGPLVPAGVLEVLPGAARRVVPVLDVVQTPLDLRGRVGLPVVAVRGHLAAGLRLRDAVRAGRVGRLRVPAALPRPQLVQA